MHYAYMYTVDKVLPFDYITNVLASHLFYSSCDKRAAVNMAYHHDEMVHRFNQEHTQKSCRSHQLGKEKNFYCHLPLEDHKNPLSFHFTLLQ